jgi:hypothetical protein
LLLERPWTRLAIIMIGEKIMNISE